MPWLVRRPVSRHRDSPMPPCRLVLVGAVFTVLLANSGLGQSVAQRRAAMIRRVDTLVTARHHDLWIPTAPPTTDQEFLRRAYLDLTGTIPRVSQAREFLDDRSNDKREKLVNRLLASPGYATHMANTWRNIMLPGGISVEQLRNLSGLQNWLRRQFVENLRYDRLVADLLISKSGEVGPALFFTALEVKPEKLAASTSRIFLGIQIECAQCHDHPFDRWTKKDFWGVASFFAQVQQRNDMRGGRTVLLEDVATGDVKLPDTDTVVRPKYPGGKQVPSENFGSRRELLAVWMASRDNPYLARAAVNRIWAHLFGRGIVEPVDDLGKHNPPSHPRLLKELENYFVDVGFDMQELLRTLALTKTYQRSARGSVTAPHLFARMAIKPMTAEQLYDSINRVLIQRRVQPLPFGAQNSRLFDQRRLAFLAKMSAQNRSRTQYRAGILQALTLMNGADTSEATSFKNSALLSALQAPSFTAKDQVEVLFLATLSRYPDKAEGEQLTKFVAASKAKVDRKKALSDVLWALLNTGEFSLNH